MLANKSEIAPDSETFESLYKNFFNNDQLYSTENTNTNKKDSRNSGSNNKKGEKKLIYARDIFK
jgi:hypothetical protein